MASFGIYHCFATPKWRISGGYPADIRSGLGPCMRSSDILLYVVFHERYIPILARKKFRAINVLLMVAISIFIVEGIPMYIHISVLSSMSTYRFFEYFFPFSQEIYYLLTATKKYLYISIIFVPLLPLYHL